MNIKIILANSCEATFSYNILSKKIEHSIECGSKKIFVNPDNNPLRDMLLNVFGDSASFINNRKRTLNAIKLCETVKKNVQKKALVVGGGIFGTTVSTLLSTSGFNVTLHEEKDGLMKCASNINQYRLHNGYHYPRSKETAKECLAGIVSFEKKYSDSIVKKKIKHYYAIAKEFSLVSKTEYLQFLDDLGLTYEIVKSNKETNLTVMVDEKSFNSERLRSQVIDRMEGVGVEVVLNKHTTRKDFGDYDYIIIATYAKINDLLIKPKLLQYEVVEKPVVRLPESYINKSMVVMDGPFMCFDPFREGMHVLGHVKHAIHETYIGEYPNVLDENILKYLNNGIIKNPKITNIEKFKEAGMKFFDDFNKLEHIGSMYTIRTVLANRDHDDARPTIVNKEEEKIFSIFSGKIGTCVESANQLVKMIKNVVL